eukprot:c20341_g1_i1 orf=186-347(+)
MLQPNQQQKSFFVFQKNFIHENIQFSKKCSNIASYVQFHGIFFPEILYRKLVE